MAGAHGLVRVDTGRSRNTEAKLNLLPYRTYARIIFFMTLHQDESERRYQLGEALMHVVAERGMTGTTLRQVADFAGVSVGLVQRYFATKDELLRFGFDHVYQRTHQRVAIVPIHPPIKQVVLAIAEAVLPLDPERSRESRVWLAFVQASLTDEKLADIHRESAMELADGLGEALQAAQRSGELSAEVDAGTEALELMALVDGLTLSGVALEERYSREVLRSILHRYVDVLFARSER